MFRRCALPGSGRHPTALVTGAGAGIGRATARRLAADGFAVMAVDIAESADTVANAINAGGSPAMAYRANVCDAEGCAAMVNACVERFGRLDVVVNNVGGIDPTVRDGEILSATDWDRTIALGLSSMFYATRAALAIMLPANRGTFVNVASVSGIVSLSGRLGYTSAKHGVIGLTKAICDTYGPQGIRCNAVAPGLVETPGLRIADQQGKSASIARFAQSIPTGRLADCEEIANGIAWLASDAASYVNGATLVMDGGYSIR